MTTPSPTFWRVIQGRSLAVVRGDDIEAARARAAQFGYHSPESIVKLTPEEYERRADIIVAWRNSLTKGTT
jgi:hypothetical protein